MSQAAAVTPSTTPSNEWGSWGQGTTIAAAVTSSTTMMNWGGGWPAESSTTSTCDEEWPMETVPPTFTHQYKRHVPRHHVALPGAELPAGWVWT